MHRSPSSHTRSFKAYLHQEFELRQKANPRYSLRQFARDLGQDPSALSRLMTGKTPIGPRSIEKLCQALLVSWDEKEHFKSESNRRRRQAGNPSPAIVPTYQQLQTDSFRVISEWYHFAILELLQLPSFKAEPQWIAKRLGISSVEVRSALDRLEQIGLIQRTQDSIRDLSGGWTTNIAQPYFAPAHRRLQKQILEMAIRALETIPLAKRDQSTITLAFPLGRMAEAKQRIKEFRRSFNQEFGHGEDRDSVFQLSVSLFPVAEIQAEIQEEQKK